MKHWVSTNKDCKCIYWNISGCSTLESFEMVMTDIIIALMFIAIIVIGGYLLSFTSFIWEALGDALTGVGDLETFVQGLYSDIMTMGIYFLYPINWLKEALAQSYTSLNSFAYETNTYPAVWYFTGTAFLLYGFEHLLLAYRGWHVYFEGTTAGEIFNVLDWPIRQILSSSSNQVYQVLVRILTIPFDLGLFAMSVIAGGIWEGLKSLWDKVSS